MRASSSEIYSQIREDIKMGRHGYQGRLPTERRLSERFDSARGTVRRALALLEQEGLIEIRKSSGSYVSMNSFSKDASVFLAARPLELMDARFAFEPHICRLAVLNARQSDIDDMEILLERMEAHVNNAVEFAELDAVFHARIVETTGNALLNWIASQINQVRGHQEWTKMRHLTLVPSIIRLYNEQHRAIFRAIRLREPEQAAACMKEHLESARLSLTRAAET